jgi:uncharacterized protein (TIGR02679 family)
MTALGQPALRKLLEAARDRLERTGTEPLGSVTVEFDADEGAAVAGLFASRRSFAGRRRVNLRQLDQRLRESGLGIGLVDLLEQIGGPLRDRKAEREASDREWQAMWESASRHPAVVGQPQLVGWLDSCRRSGLVRRLDGERLALMTALDVLADLPAEGTMLATLAARTVGGAHGLDPGRPVGTLVLSALAFTSGRPFPGGAAERRLLWGEFGVTCDTLSASVLALSLQPVSSDLVSDALRAFAAAGEPISLTLSQLRREKVRFASDHAPVLVCENPSVMDEARARLGAASGPVVCVAGRHNTAAAMLLKALREASVELRYHGDFDWGGIRIANELVSRIGVRPWRMSSAEYEVAAAAGVIPLEGRRVEAVWDRSLAEVMASAGVAVHEEAVIDTLISDLAR